MVLEPELVTRHDDGSWSAKIWRENGNVTVTLLRTALRDFDEAASWVLAMRAVLGPSGEPQG